MSIVLLAVASGIGYGILHDQVPVRVCVEYFTIGHPPLISSRGRAGTPPAFACGILARTQTFVADLWAHSASYLGFAGSIVLCPVRLAFPPRRSAIGARRSALSSKGATFPAARRPTSMTSVDRCLGPSAGPR